MAKLKNQRKLAAVGGELQKGHPKNGQWWNTLFKKSSQRISWTKTRILTALSKLDEYLLNTKVRAHSGTLPRTTRNTDVKAQEPNVDRSQNDIRPDVWPFVY